MGWGDTELYMIVIYETHLVYSWTRLVSKQISIFTDTANLIEDYLI